MAKRGTVEDRENPAPLESGAGEAGSPWAEPGAVWKALAPFATPGRLERLRKVMDARTLGLVPVLDNLYDPHNLSAILRTADALGIQRIVLSGQVPDGVNPRVALGAHRWLSVERFPDPARAVERLRSEGYLLAATVLDETALSPWAFEPDRPVALVLGNEHDGISKPWLEAAEARLTIPLAGFSGSLNVSVAAALCMHCLLRKSVCREHPVEGKERDLLLDRWIRQSVPNADKILARLAVRR